MHQSKVYFKGLNGLRFFAAFLVLMHHAEIIRVKYDLFNLSGYSVFNCGLLAVDFFFVLSGFLITYLLLEEHAHSGTIDIRQFYMRRVRRIWPLYYLILIIGLILIPIAIKLLHIDYALPYSFAAYLLLIFFLPNLFFTTWESSFLAPLWSIGVEEQFYLFWAPLVKYFRKNLLAIFLSIIAIRIIFYAFYFRIEATGPTGTIVANFFLTMKFEAMSIGGLGAWLLFKYREKLLHPILFSRGMQVFLLGLIITRLFFHRSIIENAGWIGQTYKSLAESLFSVLITAPLFLWLILNISTNSRTIISTNNRVLNFLGTISYGIYMYHIIVLFIVMTFLKGVLAQLSPLPATILLYVVSGGLTILVSYLSYHFIELPFLRFKKVNEPALATRQV